MTDKTWIKAFNGKSIYTADQLQAGSVASKGRVTAGEYVQLDKVSVVDTLAPRRDY